METLNMTKSQRLDWYKSRQTKVSQNTIDAINLLKECLSQEFSNGDYSFSVMGRGHYVAMNTIEGQIDAAVITENPASDPASK